MNKDEYEQLRVDFECLEGWEDRYRYIIELGQSLPPLDEKAKTETNKVQGCVSQVWLSYDVVEDGNEKRLTFYGESDAHIVQGLVAVAIKLFSGSTANAIKAAKPRDAFAALGLQEHLSAQRSNGLKSLLQRIEDIATHFAD